MGLTQFRHSIDGHLVFFNFLLQILLHRMYCVVVSLGSCVFSLGEILRIDLLSEYLCVVWSCQMPSTGPIIRIEFPLFTFLSTLDTNK